MRLGGIELRGFRSIAGKPVVLTPWKRCNILVGKNNTGKSNVIRAIEKISTTLIANAGSLHELDLHRRSAENAFQFTLTIDLSDPQDSELSKLTGTDFVSFSFHLSKDNPRPLVDRLFLGEMADWEKSRQLLPRLTNVGFRRPVDSGEVLKTFMQHSETVWEKFRGIVRPVEIIGEFRQILPGEKYELKGTNLVSLLASYQHPKVGQDADREKFDQIQAFVRELVHLPHAELEVTHDGNMILLKNADLRLPLASYGTGVHELVIMLTAVLHAENSIVCIEEPEIHLHPTLQREFLDFILANTANDYILSTHSSAFINAAETHDDVQVFRIWLEDGASVGGPVLTERDCLDALRDLGVRASDLLQANCIVWVEGPSDRLYLNRWLRLVAPDLTEGRHYTTMFYGGDQLAYLDACRGETPEELVNILSINQNAIVVMDSDRASETDPVSKKKQTIRQQVNDNGGLCWVTDGLEIENYLAPRVVQAVLAKWSQGTIQFQLGPFDDFCQVLAHTLSAAGISGSPSPRNKSVWARLFMEKCELADLSEPLKQRLTAVTDRIRSWNG